MEDVGTERWRELCELALKEQDPEKLVRLAREINRLLTEREQAVGSRTAAQAESLHKAS